MIYHGDNLAIMRDMESGSVDLIATDPPYNTGKDFGAYNDRWTDYVCTEEYCEVDRVNGAARNAIDAAQSCHSSGMANFLIFLTIRLFEMHRLLSDTGSIYVQCDGAANGYVRLIMDAVFRPKNFRNEIIWAYSSGGASTKQFAKQHDTIFWYTKTEDYYKLIPREPYATLNVETSKDAANYHPAGRIMKDVWNIGILSTTAKERTGYPTQKPIALYERMIKASCPEGGLVLDPFMGSGTTLVAARNLGRRHIGIDANPEAVSIAERRLADVLI